MSARQLVVEGAQQRHPRPLAVGDLVELLLHPRRELDVDVGPEVLDQEVGDDLRDGLGVEPSLLDADVAAVGDGRDRRRVGGRPADAVLLERLDQRRLGEARRRFGEVLGRRDVGDVGDAALGQDRQAGAGFVLVVGGGVVAAFGVDDGEAVEQDLRRRRAQLVAAVGQLDRRRLELLGRHLRRQRALPDQPVQARLVGLQEGGHRIRVAPEAGRADRLVCLLGALRLRLVDAALGHRVRLAVALADDLARLAHRDAGDGRRVGAHVGDEADLALGGLDALVQALRDGHRPLRAEAEPAAGLLLERRCRERRRGRPLLGPRPELGDDRMQLADRRDVRVRGRLVGDVERLAVDPDELRGERLAGRGREDRLDRPVLACRERPDLALALDDEADGDRLDPAGRQAALDLLAEERAQRVADEAVDDAARLLGVDEVHVDLARIGEGLADRRLGDLVEGHPLLLVAGDVGRLGDVPGDRLALAVEVGGEEDQVGGLGRLGDLGDLLAAVVRDHVLRCEVVVDVDAELALARVLGQVADVAV